MSYSRLTWADVKASRLPEELELCASTDEARLLKIVNEACKRILDQSEAWGLSVRYRCQATEGRLVWPRQIAQPLSVAYGLASDTSSGASTPLLTPAKIRDDFFEFLELGMGIQDANNAGSRDLLARGQTCLFREMTGTTNLVGVYCDLADDNAASATPVPVLLLGYDGNLNWIRTKTAGVWHDGEYVTADNTNPYGALSTHAFSQVTGVQKPQCNGSIRLYQVDPVTHDQVPIARYDYDETNPVYTVSYIPYLDSYASADNPATVEVMARLQLIPVRRDTDYLTIPNLPALIDMSSAIIKSQQESLTVKKAEALSAGLAMAKLSLEGEFRRMRGRVDAVMPMAGMGGPTETAVMNLF